MNVCLSFVYQERTAETNSNVDSSAQPSVAQLAGRFREQAAVAREVNVEPGLEEEDAHQTLRGKQAGGALAITKLGREAREGPSECEECGTDLLLLGRESFPTRVGFPPW